MKIEKESHKQEKKKSKEIQNIKKTHKYWLGGYALIALGCIALYFLFRFEVIPTVGKRVLLIRLSIFAFVAFIILLAGKFGEMLIVKSQKSKSFKYNFVRFIRLITGILIVIVVVSFLFENWYAAALSLGLISLILGFALQVPISSFIGWLYLIFRSPYRVGDRIEIDQFTGDVVEVSYLDTTLSEFGGNYLSNDLPSGRLIRFPNSLVLSSAVFNYSWPQFPFIWNEIAFQVAYNSDLDFVKQTIRETTRKELDPDMPENIEKLKELIQKTPVDNLQIKEYPYVSIRINANTWVEILVTYLVHPKKASFTRTMIIENTLNNLNQYPDKVKFPKGDSR